MGGAFQDGPVILGERSTASPDLASRGGQLHLGWTGSDYRLNLLIAPDGRHFTGKRRLLAKSSRSKMDLSGGDIVTRVLEMAPALAGSAAGLPLAWTRVVAMAPALAGSAAGLRLAWTGTDRHLNLTTFDDAGT